MEIIMEDKELIEKLKAIRAVIDQIEKREQFSMKLTLDDTSFEESLKQ